MSTILDKTLGQLVVEDYRRADILKSHNLDFCCGGKQTLEQACAEKQLFVDDIIAQLEQIPASSKASENIDTWPADLLCDYIEKKHHRYVENSIPIIKSYLEKVWAAHGTQNPSLATVKSIFFATADELTLHLKKEELVLFPYIRKLTSHQISGTKDINPPSFNSVQNPIQTMLDEHEQAGANLREIAAITNNYQPPASACNTYRVLLAKLQEFENDLHRHVHLENNVLFEKAIQMEQSILAT